MIARLKRLWADERGESLPETLVTVIISALTLTLVAAAIVGTSSFVSLLGDAGRDSTQRSLTEAQWRSDVQSSTVTKDITSTSVSFAAVNSSGTCVTDTWSVGASAGVTQVSMTADQYSTEMDAAGCLGSVSSTKTQIMLDRVSASAAFAFWNPGGRSMNFSAAPMALATGAAPTGISVPKWNSTSVGFAALNADTWNGSAFRPFRLNQATTQRPITTGASDSPSSYLP